MQFIGDFQINPDICDRLIALHKEADRKRLVIRGGFGKGDKIIVDTDKKDSFDLGLVTVPDELIEKYKVPE